MLWCHKIKFSLLGLSIEVRDSTNQITESCFSEIHFRITKSLVKKINKHHLNPTALLVLIVHFYLCLQLECFLEPLVKPVYPIGQLTGESLSPNAEGGAEHSHLKHHVHLKWKVGSDLREGKKNMSFFSQLQLMYHNYSRKHLVGSYVWKFCSVQWSTGTTTKLILVLTHMYMYVIRMAISLSQL